MSWDGKIYDKYRIAHADGTPLKGKEYFVLRLDSDDPVEAARVAAAMRAYKGTIRNCDRFHTMDEAEAAYLQTHQRIIVRVFIDWLFAPAEEGGAK